MIFTARVRLRQDLIDPRGRGDAVMTHHAEFGSVLQAEEWAGRVADRAQNGPMGQRWLAARSGAPVHRVEVFRRSIEDRSSYEQVAEASFSLDEPVGGASLPVPGLPLLTIEYSALHVVPDSAAAILVVEDAYAGTTPFSRRCYVGPVAPVHLVGVMSAPLIGDEESAYYIVPGLTGDDPSWLFDSQGWWGDAIADDAALYLRELHDEAVDLGGWTAVVSWKAGAASEVVQWRASSVRARMRSRGTESTFRPPLQRDATSWP